MSDSHLFSPILVGRVTLKNRIVMAPMGSMLCNPDGSVSEALYHYYVQRAKGGVGLIILEVTAMDYHNSVAAITQLQLTDRSMLPAMSRLACGIHDYGAKVIAQLQHAGARCMNPDYRAVSASGGISAAKQPVFELTKEEIKALVEKFAAAAKNAQDAGLDGVEIHAGHGYLVGQFLSPLSNRRNDEYGGGRENRARFLTDIIRTVRKACGPEFLLSVRLAVRDNKPGGITPEEGIVFAKMVEAAGADMINITTGITVPLNTSVETQDKADGNRIDLAEAVRPHVKIPTAIVGKLRDPEMCERIIADGKADLVCLGRQLICDPYWPEKVQWGRRKEIRRCLSCSEGCYNFIRGIQCACNPYAGKEWIYSERDLPPTRKPKKVVVVGGGVAGMQAALIAAQRGHNVILLEADTQLGGRLIPASRPPHKEVLLAFRDYLEYSLKMTGVEIRLGAAETAQTILSLAPDKVIIAVGTHPAVPRFKGGTLTSFAEDLLAGITPVPMNKRVAIIGGGTIGCETALYLHGFGNTLSIIEQTDVLAKGQQSTHRTRDLTLLKEYGVAFHLGCTVLEVNGKGVLCSNKEDQEFSISADVTLTACGQTPLGTALYENLRVANVPTVLVGSCAGTLNIRTSVAMGFAAGYEA